MTIAALVSLKNLWLMEKVSKGRWWYISITI